MSRAAWGACLLAFAALAAGVHAPAMSGPFVSDDVAYLVSHPYTGSLSLGNLGAIFDPRSPAMLYTGNYAPLHLLLSALERAILGASPFGYHALNVALHALDAWLLALLFARAGLGATAAVGGALFFLLHPANVEAVAWSSQLKSVAALAFGLLAALTFERRPGSATLLFALAIGCKAQALFLLPSAAAWLATREGASCRRHWRWLALGVLLAAFVSSAQWIAFDHLGRLHESPFPDAATWLRTLFAVLARYAAMALVGFGVSAFHQPAPSGLLDPWWILGVGVAVALGLRIALAFRTRGRELVFWIAAAAAYAPVSQLVSFPHPLGDRHLYMVLPGLVGAGLCAARGLRPSARRVLAFSFGALCLLFAVVSHQRAGLWQDELWLMLDSARHYPDGAPAHWLNARAAAGAGDPDAALAHLRRAAERGFDRFAVLGHDPGLAPLRGHPDFEAFASELAGRWLERDRQRRRATQPDLRMRAAAHRVRAERVAEIAALEAALALGGPWDAPIREELAAARARAERDPG